MKRWFKYIKPYWVYFVLGPLCMIVEVIGEVFIPKLYSQIINNGVNNQNVGYIVGMAALMVGVSVLMLLGGVGGAYFGAKASVNFGADLRQDLYNKVQKYSFANIDKFQTGSLVTRLTNDVTQMQNMVNMLLRMCLRAPGMMIGAIIMAVIMNARLALILAVIMPFMIIVLFFLIKYAFPKFGIMQTKLDALNTNVQESITNIRVVKSFVREDHQRKTFAKANKDLKDTGISAMNVMIIMMPLMMLFMNLASLAVVWFGGQEVMDTVINATGGMDVGDLSAFLTYITQILSSLMMLSMLFVFSSRALASSKRVREVLDEVPDIDDANAADADRKVTNGDIEFRNVVFRYYKTSEDPVLDHISFKVRGGQTVGIIGSTGCGKTTLVSMIPRLYDADEGEIIVDGVNVRDYSLKNLRDGVGMVLQKNVLFSGTIAQNLEWGDENATHDEIVSAAEKAQANGFVSAMKDGYDTVLDQGGTNVSGGQKQRLCIARALLKKPKILILDDSTSAVDTATESRIRTALKTDLAGTTKIIIAQRISSVMDADEIIVMSDGRITGIGKHDELIRSNEEYREIYISQTGKEVDA
ncbi:MAG: ABC transporter ATP-binding protein [Ruminococcus sp.]|nr:ABC transporter ATP-binding protein/permease [Ruminococcus sp.]MDD6300450.1 ABC transporter ATP-binding protein [Ruminococcus sp.]